jgi:CspA family cold shock protein
VTANASGLLARLIGGDGLFRIEFLPIHWEFSQRGCAVPTGKVKWYDPEKGFGFLTRDDGGDVFVRASALPAGVTSLKPGSRVEFGIVESKRGEQALSVRLLDPLPSLVAAQRKKPDELVVIIEDLIKLLDGVSNTLRRGRYPDRTTSRKVAAVLRAVADDLEPPH